MGEEAVLRNAHGVYHAAYTVVLGTASVGLGIREDNLGTTGVDTSTGAGALAPEIVPATYKLDCQLVLVLIVGSCRCVFIHRAVAMFVIGIAPVVPIFTQAFVAAVFGLNHGVMLALIYIEHLAAILCLANIEHLARTDSTSAMRVVKVADIAHFDHVLARY